MNTPTNRPVVLLGAGGHARVLLAVLRANGTPVIGCIAPGEPEPWWSSQIPWLGGDEALSRLDAGGVALVNGIGSTGSTALRRRVFEAGRAQGFHFATLVHPQSIVIDPTDLGPGAQIMAGAVVQTGVKVGANAIVNSGAVVDHDSQLGAHCHVAPGATLSGGVRVGQGAHIGTGATVIQGISIGDNALVAAGAVVIRDIAENARVGGVPARPLGASGARRLGQSS